MFQHVISTPKRVITENWLIVIWSKVENCRKLSKILQEMVEKRSESREKVFLHITNTPLRVITENWLTWHMVQSRTLSKIVENSSRNGRKKVGKHRQSVSTCYQYSLTCYNWKLTYFHFVQSRTLSKIVQNCRKFFEKWSKKGRKAEKKCFYMLWILPYVI